MNRMKQTIMNYPFWVLSAIFTAVYFVIVYRFTINIPIDDDFPALQNFLVKYVQSESIHEKISLLMDGHGIGNIHRLLLSRLIVLSIYALSGTLNYSAYAFIINLFFIGTGILIYTMIFNKNAKGLMVLLMILLLLNNQNIIQSVYVLCGLSHVGVIFIGFSSMYLLLFNNRVSFICGLLLSTLTVYSNGNGMLIIPPLIACFCIQKRIKELSILGILSLITVFFYFYNLNISRLSGNVFDDFYIKVMYFFTFIGGNLWIPSIKFISLFLGLFCCFVYIWGIFKKLYVNNLLCYACLTFLYLTAVAVAIGNSKIDMPIYYRIYSSFFLILTILLLINNAKAFYLQKIIYFFPIPALIFNLFSNILYSPEMRKIVEEKKVSAYNWVNKGDGLMAYLAYAAESKFYLKEAEQLELYKMPHYPLIEYKSATVSAYKRDFFVEGILYKIETIEEKDNFLIIEGWSYFKSAAMDHTDIFVYLNDSKNQLGYRTHFKRKYDVDATKMKSGFFTVIDKKEIPHGTYKIEIGIKNRLNIKGRILYISTEQYLEI